MMTAPASMTQRTQQAEPRPKGTAYPDISAARTLRLRDGSTLAWRTFGARRGRPLYFFHGFPSSGLLGSLVHEAAALADIAIIAPDRPGFGASTPQPGRTIAGWAEDVAELADHLDHDRFGVLGVSCGGPYALACAQLIPHRLSYVGTMAGIGPMNVPGIRKGQLPPLQALFALAKLHPVLATPILLADAWLFRRAPERALDAISKLLTAPDRAMLAAHPDARARFAASFVDAYRQGIDAARREARLIARLDRRMLYGIRTTVHVYQGGRDRHVPADMGSYVAAALPAGRLHFFPDEGHLSILVNRFADCAAHFHDASAHGTA
jgi:pimeloyl-ACP methyl ester carboxylesterase